MTQVTIRRVLLHGFALWNPALLPDAEVIQVDSPMPKGRVVYVGGVGGVHFTWQVLIGDTLHVASREVPEDREWPTLKVKREDRLVFEWEEEFGGGGWVQYGPQSVPEPVGADATVRNIHNSVLYGPGYQSQPSTRHGRGIWVSSRGNRQGY